MEIALCRIDDRLIHGQILTMWSKESGCNRILVVNDEVSKDIIRKTLLMQIAPTGIKVNVVSIEKALEAYNNSNNKDINTLILTTNPEDVLKLVEGGVEINSVNIGGMSFKEGKKQITPSVYVDEEDIENFKKLYDRGIELELRRVSTDIKVDLMTKI